MSFHPRTGATEQLIESGLVGQGTPDVRFTDSIVVHGDVCGRLEFKDYFDFSSNPFVAQKERKQLKKYVVRFGAGVVVYSCGFQRESPKVVGVRAFRAAKFLDFVVPANQRITSYIAANDQSSEDCSTPGS